MSHYPGHEKPKKRKPRKAPNNPERKSTMPAGKRLHRSEEKRMKQPKVTKGADRGTTNKKPSSPLRKGGIVGGLRRASDALR